jgi:hypothetical protein
MVAGPVHFAVHHKASGREIAEIEVQLWTFGPDGRVTRFRHVLGARPYAQI